MRLQSLRLRLAVSGIAILLLALCGGASAAPTMEAASDSNVAGETHLPEVGADNRSTSRTIRLLLELQGAPPPIEGATDPQRSGKSGAAASAPRPALPGFEMPNSFASGSSNASAAPGAAAPAATSPAAAGKVDWRVGLSSGFGNGSFASTMPLHDNGHSQQRSSRPGSDEEMDAIKALLPERLFALLREYREWLLAGGTLVLIVLSISAALASQARR